MRFLLFSWFFLLHGISVFFGLHKISVNCQCLEDQALLLLQFKQSLSFNLVYANSNLASWNSSTDCCSWEGVTCDGDAGHVIGLDLSSIFISGDIDNSSSLFHLRYLEYLNLAFNNFNFSTSRFDQLISLTNLNLSYSGLSGIIPIEISRLTRLVSLDLSSTCWRAEDLRDALCTEWSLKAPDLRMLVGNMTSLRTLHLNNVRIWAQGSEWCKALSSALPNLQVLSLSNCHLQGFIDSSLSNLRLLSEINLDYNYISDEVPQSFANFLNLTSLHLRRCHLSGTFPEKILQLTTLQTLDVSENPSLQGSLPEFPLNASLRNLLLYYTSFSGYLPESIGKLLLLSELSLSGCSFTGSIPPSIGNLTQLVSLRLNDNSFSGSIPSSIGNLTQLVYLMLYNNSFSGSIPSSIGNLTQLVYLMLYDNSFSGSIPSSIVNLTQLVYLVLSDNNFTGPIPLLPENLQEVYLANNHLTGSLPSSHWKRLLKLWYLDLTNNSLSGTIPSCLFTLPSLKYLQVSQNQLDGQLPEFSNVSLASLYTLDLSYNKLEGPIPISIFELRNLRELQLSSNNFSGTVQLGLFPKLEILEYLDLSHNSLSINTSVSNSTLFSLPHITTIRLASCKLRVFPDFLKINQPELTGLDLSDNQIHGKIPSWIWRINNNSFLYLNLSRNFLVDLERPLHEIDGISLKVVDLRSNHLQGPIPMLSGATPYYLDFSHNSFNSIPANIDLSNIRFFSLASNNLTGEIPSSVCNATDLVVLDVSNNSLSGPIPSCLSNFTFTKVLNLRQNNFSGTMPNEFPDGCDLRMLDLSANILKGQVSTTLANCTQLEFLDLGNNQINDTFPTWLGKLSQLHVLVLRSNQFYGSINDLRFNYTFPMLQIIDLSSNGLFSNLPWATFSTWKSMMVNKDETPTELKIEIQISLANEKEQVYPDSMTLTSKGQKMELVKILRIFTHIDFSDNKFQGDIPQVMGNLTLLYSLNLSHNVLTGRIPSSLGNLRQLESLDLSQNKLTGEIPPQLASLTFLSSLNLSHNKLEGMIPRGTQFQTFSEASFNGNDGLCGLPSSRNCTNDEALSPQSSFEHTSSKFVFGYDWQFVLSGLSTGFGLGFGTIVAFFLFSKKGRTWLLARPRS